METKPETPEWEKEFDKEFKSEMEFSNWDMKEIKSFIIQVRNAALEEAAEAVEKIERYGNHNMSSPNKGDTVFLSDIQATIRSLKKK